MRAHQLGFSIKKPLKTTKLKWKEDKHQQQQQRTDTLLLEYNQLSRNVASANAIK